MSKDFTQFQYQKHKQCSEISQGQGLPSKKREPYDFSFNSIRKFEDQGRLYSQPLNNQNQSQQQLLGTVISCHANETPFEPTSTTANFDFDIACSNSQPSSTTSYETPQHSPEALQINYDNTSSPANQNAAVVGAKKTTTAIGKQRRSKPVPDKLKNETYWLKRQRNNDAARKSRDTKRAKYDELAVRVALLEKENAHLHGDNLRLMGEVDQLQAILRIYTTTTELPAQIW